MASKRSVSANFSSQPIDYQNYVDGAFTGIADNYIDVFNPATGDLLGRVPDASEADVDHAVKAARKALTAWEKRPAVERAQYLRQISSHRACRCHHQGTRQNGRPRPGRS